MATYTYKVILPFESPDYTLTVGQIVAFEDADVALIERTQTGTLSFVVGELVTETREETPAEGVDLSAGEPTAEPVSNRQVKKAAKR